MSCTMNSKVELGSLFHTTDSSSGGTGNEFKFSVGERCGTDSPSTQSEDSQVAIAPPNSPCTPEAIYLPTPGRNSHSDSSSSRSRKLRELSRELHSISDERKCLKGSSPSIYVHKITPKDRKRIEKWRYQVSSETSAEIEPLPAPRLLGKLLANMENLEKESCSGAKGSDEDVVTIRHRTERRGRMRFASWEVSFNHIAVDEAPKPKFLPKLFQ